MFGYFICESEYVQNMRGVRVRCSTKSHSTYVRILNMRMRICAKYERCTVREVFYQQSSEYVRILHMRMRICAKYERCSCEVLYQQSREYVRLLHMLMRICAKYLRCSFGSSGRVKPAAMVHVATEVGGAEDRSGRFSRVQTSLPDKPVAPLTVKFRSILILRIYTYPYQGRTKKSGRQGGKVG